MKTLILVILFLALPLAIHAKDFGRPVMNIFTAKVSNVRLAGTLTEQGKDMDDMVSVKVQAIIFPKELKIPDVRKAESYNQPAIDTYVRYNRACMNGSAEELARYWAKLERKEQKKLLADPEMLSRTHDYFRSNPGITIVGLIFNDNQTTVLTREMFGVTETVMGTSMVHEDGGTFLTNKPTNDLDIAIIEGSFLSVQRQ